MDYDWIGTMAIQKNSIKNSGKKTVKIEAKMPHLNKKPLARKQIFVHTPFSHST